MFNTADLSGQWILGTTSGHLESGNFADFPCKRHQTKRLVLTTFERTMPDNVELEDILAYLRCDYGPGSSVQCLRRWTLADKNVPAKFGGRTGLSRTQLCERRLICRVCDGNRLYYIADGALSRDMRERLFLCGKNAKGC